MDMIKFFTRTLVSNLLGTLKCIPYFVSFIVLGGIYASSLNVEPKIIASFVYGASLSVPVIMAIDVVAAITATALVKCKGK